MGKSWDIYIWKFLDDDFLKFMEDEFQNINEICFFFQLIYICDKKAGWKKPTVEKTFIILIQSIIFFNGGLLQRERRNFKRNFDNI